MEREWRCRECGTLLATTTGARVYVSHRGAQYAIEGGQFSVLAVCRSCKAMNECRSEQLKNPIPIGEERLLEDPRGGSREARQAQ